MILPRLRKSTFVKIFILVMVLFMTITFILQRTEINGRLNFSVGEKTYQRRQVIDLGRVRTQEEAKMKERGFRQQAFNVYVSDKLDPVRPIPDTRSPKCPSQRQRLPPLRASIVICFYNEAASVLRRTVDSILARTPHSLIASIILVDDASRLEETASAVSQLRVRHANTASRLPPLLVTRNGGRIGLVKSRVRGAALARDGALVFLDSHVEVNREWLEPLLWRLVEHPKDVAIPVVDIISHETMEYTASPLVRGGFNWGLHFSWISMPKEIAVQADQYTAPVPTPVMSGGLLAMRREWYRQLGGYDEGMETWGGENLEMSFRVWQCGGSMHILPCSRVGHIFRTRRPYGEVSNRDSFLYNTLRMARVWMDDYIKLFYNVRPDAQHQPSGDISARLALRHRLGCRPFRWYLQNVYPEMFTEAVKKMEKKKDEAPASRPTHPTSSSTLLMLGLGSVRRCLTTAEHQPDQIVLSPCVSSNLRQRFLETAAHEIRQNERCLDADATPLRFQKCHGQRQGQEWVMRRSGHLMNPKSARCLSNTPDGGVGLGSCTLRVRHNLNRILRLPLD